MIPVDVFIDAMRERLEAARLEAVGIMAASLRTGETHTAIVKAGIIQGLEDAAEIINEIITDSRKGA